MIEGAWKIYWNGQQIRFLIVHFSFIGASHSNYRSPGCFAKEDRNWEGQTRYISQEIAFSNGK